MVHDQAQVLEIRNFFISRVREIVLKEHIKQDW